MAGNETIDALGQNLSELRIAEEEILVYVGESKFTCRKQILIENSKYFEALFNFDSDRKEVRLESDLSVSVARSIIEFFETGNINFDSENVQDVLTGSIFLGCRKLEGKAVDCLVKTFSSDSVFNLYHFSKIIGCDKLQIEAEKYIVKIFGIFLLVTTKKKNVEEFLALESSVLINFLKKDIQCDEKLILFCIIGWLDHCEERSLEAEKLLSLINLLLVPETNKNQLVHHPVHSEVIHKILKQSKTHLARNEIRMQMQMSSFVPVKTKPNNQRWPKLMVALTPGKNGNRKLEYLDFTDKFPQWKQLARKTVSLDLLSGFSLVYLYPRIYFLGERKWHLHWYDTEMDSWGLWEGFSMSKLLAGSTSTKDFIILVGGVNVEEWSKSSIELSTTPSVDVINPNNNFYSSYPSLHQGVSSPVVTIFNDHVYSFGGLQKRKAKKDSYRLNLTDNSNPSSWETISPMPVDISYPSIIADEIRQGIWIIGGMRIPSRIEDTGQEMRGETYFYSPTKDEWIEGPCLNVPRKSAFSYKINDDIYVSGGISEDLKPVSITEVLKKESDSWEMISANWKHNFVSNVCVMIHKPHRLIKL